MCHQAGQSMKRKVGYKLIMNGLFLKKYYCLFTFCLQWLPEKWQYQLLFLLYRWVIAIFFVAELLVTAITENAGPKYFIFLTNLGFMMFTLYTVWSAVSVTVRFLQIHVICKGKVIELDMHPSTLEEPTLQGGCARVDNTISWFQMIQWLLFTLGVETALGITLLFWSLLYRPGHDDFYLSNNILVPHLVNGVTALMETWLTSIPIRLLHFIYPAAFGAGYILFTGIYFVANGTNPNGSHYIYPVLDYGNNLGFAIGVDVIVLTVVLPLLHVLFFVQFMMRSALANWLKKKCYLRYKKVITAYDVLPDAEEEIEKRTRC